MSQTDLPSIANFENIRKLISVERKTIIKVNNMNSSDQDYVRSVEDAQIILDFLENIQTKLYEFFKIYDSLIPFFSKQFTNFEEFIQRESVLDLCFLDDCLFPEKEIFFFGQDGAINKNVLQLHEKALIDWMDEKSTAHNTVQKELRENFSLEIKPSEMSCQCVQCAGDYRTKLRDFVLNESLNKIDDSYRIMMETIDSKSINEVNDIFVNMQKEIDQILYKVRYRLKRSTINRLESQIKANIKDKFTYPSELAGKQEEKLIPFFKNLLYEEDIKDDLVGDTEFKRFFNQLGYHLWKTEKYLTREFKKVVKSIMVLKRKDISGKILQEYIGEFWGHSQARTIKRKIVYHMGPTNSGKTYHAIEKLASVEKGCYLAPLRLLAAELYDTLNAKDVVTTLLTGEEVIEKEGATHYSSTIEMARLNEIFDCCVIDEIQMITDSSRGWAWTRALVNIFATEVHLCGDGSVLDLVQKIVDLCGDELEIRNYDRMTKLEVQKRPVVLGDLDKSDALIVFSRRNALRYKRDLEKVGFKVSIVYGRLSPEVRREQARKFDQGETDIMVSTDAIAMGMNLPIKRIIFSTLVKYINNQEHPITESEIKQIAGRAGRFKRFPTGYVTCLTKVEDGLESIQDALQTVLDQQTKCMVGPDLDIFSQVNKALEDNGLHRLRLSEFLRLFNTMSFQKPFYCVELKEMIELAEMVEEADTDERLSSSEVFGFACAPVNLGLLEHVQYYVWILNHYVAEQSIINEPINYKSNDIDYLETSIKCVELYQWLSRHFDNKNFMFDEQELLNNKSMAIEKLNSLLSDKIVPTCSSCGVKMPENSRFNICDPCFKERRFARGRPGRKGYSSQKDGGGSSPEKGGRKFGGKSKFKKEGSGKKKFENRKKKRKFSR